MEKNIISDEDRKKKNKEYLQPLKGPKISLSYYWILSDIEGWFRFSGCNHGCDSHIFLPEDLIYHLLEIGRATLNMMSNPVVTANNYLASGLVEG